MSIEFKLPDLGENISSAGVLAVLVKPGDTIQQDTPVLEIETDKATIEVPSTVSKTPSATASSARPPPPAPPGTASSPTETTSARWGRRWCG